MLTDCDYSTYSGEIGAHGLSITLGDIDSDGDLDACLATEIDNAEFVGHSRLTSIGSNSFAGLSNLKVLGLPDNQIRSLKKGYFDDLINLEALFVGYQPLHFDNGIFERLSNNAIR